MGAAVVQAVAIALMGGRELVAKGVTVGGSGMTYVCTWEGMLMEQSQAVPFATMGGWQGWRTEPDPTAFGAAHAFVEIVGADAATVALLIPAMRETLGRAGHRRLPAAAQDSRERRARIALRKLGLLTDDRRSVTPDGRRLLARGLVS